MFTQKYSALIYLTLICILFFSSSALKAELHAPHSFTQSRSYYVAPNPKLRTLKDGRLGGRAYSLCLKAVVSPFDPSDNASLDNDDEDGDDYELELTRENVEKVLDEMRPFLQADGGEVALKEIDGPVVKLELLGACGSCPSSSMTMKMGLERKLKEKIPEIAEVVQALPNVPEITGESVETILDSVRPFLAVAGGKITIDSISGVSSLQPLINLKMEGQAASLQSVKLEIMQRIQRHFMQPALRIEWV